MDNHSWLIWLRPQLSVSILLCVNEILTSKKLEVFKEILPLSTMLCSNYEDVRKAGLHLNISGLNEDY